MRPWSGRHTIDRSVRTSPCSTARHAPAAALRYPAALNTATGAATSFLRPSLAAGVIV